MTDVCSKEKEIKELTEITKKYTDRLVLIEKRQIGIASDVSHIKGRIDNGISNTVSDMHKNLTMLIPVIEQHTRFIELVQDFLFSAIKWFLFGFSISIICLMGWAIANGWKP